MRLKRIILAVACCLSIVSRAETLCVRISDQAAFDTLGRTVRSFLEGEGTELELQLDSGRFFYRDRHLSLEGVDAPGKVIRIAGNHTSLYPSLIQADYSPETCRYAAGPQGPVAVPEVREMKKAGFFVCVTDRKNKICRIRTDREQDPSLAGNGYVFLTQWFRGRAYPITAVRGKYVYFRVEDLRLKRVLYSVNLDWTFAMMFPRYCILDGRKEMARADLSADATTFCSLRQANLGGFSLSGIGFIGNSRLPDAPQALIAIEKSNTPVRIERCLFSQIRSDCLTVSSSDDITVEDCTFEDCYRRCISADNGSARIAILRNRIDRSGLSGDNVACLSCYGTDFQIRDNIISDFGYTAIHSGLHFSLEKKEPLTGVISGNEIFQTPSYFAAAPLTGLMDSGAIYVATQNDDVLIEGNHIHDINGPTYNRGIFVDDGGSHIRMIGNTVTGIANYYCIDVDPRSARKMLRRKNRQVQIANVDVEVCDNVVSGKMRVSKPRRAWWKARRP